MGRLSSPRGSMLALAIFALALLVLLQACRGQESSSSTGGGGSVSFSPAWNDKSGVMLSPYPLVVGPASVEVVLARDDGSPIKGAKVEVEAFRPQGNETPITSSAEELTREIIGEAARQMYGTEVAHETRYVTHDFRFTTPGDWVIKVTAVLPDGQRLLYTLDVPVSSQ
jgi:hypothetical protein